MWGLTPNERRFFLIAFDLIAMNAALAVSLALRSPFSTHIDWIFHHPFWFLILSFLWLLWAWSFEAYNIKIMHHFALSVRSALQSALVVTSIYLLIPYITPPLPSRRLMIFAFPLLCFAFLILARVVYHFTFKQIAFCRRVLILGAGWAGRTIAETIVEYGSGAYDIVGFIDDDTEKLGKTVITWPVLGNRYSLKDLIEKHNITTLVVAITRNLEASLLGILVDCLELCVEIIPMNVLYECLTGRVTIYHIGSNWYIALPIDHPLTKIFNRVFKRIFDIVFASLGLLLLAPFFPLIATAIYIDSPGPIFYTQDRVGRGGRIFKVYKFRSMVLNAEQGKAIWASECDPRVTRVGRILRKTHIDEFPQILNILKGDMSVVGPRPERPEFVESLVQEIPFYRIRHAVKPGMAGWALVKYGYASSKEDTIEKLQYDLYYIKYQSLWLDLVILVKTVLDTITFRGRA